MDGRTTLALAAGLLAGLAGCDQKRLLPVWPGWRTGAPDVEATPKVEMGNKPISSQPVELKPATLVAVASVHEQEALEPRLTAQQREHLLEQARKAYHRALQLDGKHLPAHLGLARLYERMGNHDRAMASYQEVLKLEPKNAALYHEVGMVLARRKDWDGALRMLQQATELDPDNRTLVRSYGLALARAGRTADSLVQLRKVLDEAEAHFMIARMQHHLKQPEACRHHLELALRLNPNLPAAQQLLDELQGKAAPAPARGTRPASVADEGIDLDAEAGPAPVAPIDPDLAAAADTAEAAEPE